MLVTLNLELHTPKSHKTHRNIIFNISMVPSSWPFFLSGGSSAVCLLCCQGFRVSHSDVLIMKAIVSPPKLGSDTCTRAKGVCHSERCPPKDLLNILQALTSAPSKMTSGACILFFLAACLIMSSASPALPWESSHLGDSGMNLTDRVGRSGSLDHFNELVCQWVKSIRWQWQTVVH